MSNAYHFLYLAVLIALGVLIGITLIRAVVGPRVTDRILSINMIGTMVISSIVILSLLLEEEYLVDVALIYGMISFITALIMAMIYIPANPRRSIYYNEEQEKIYRMEEALKEAAKQDEKEASGEEGKDASRENADEEAREKETEETKGDGLSGSQEKSPSGEIG